METSPPVKAFLDAAYGMGLPKCPDLNVPEPYGVCASPYNIKDGKRQSTVIAYLNQARGRKNLTIVDQATGSFAELSGKKAEGVNYEKDGQLHTALGGQILRHFRRLRFAADPDAVRHRAVGGTQETRHCRRARTKRHRRKLSGSPGGVHDLRRRRRNSTTIGSCRAFG